MRSPLNLMIAIASAAILTISHASFADKVAGNGYIVKFQFSEVPHYTLQGDQKDKMFDATVLSKKDFPIPVKYIPSDTSLVMVEIAGQTYYFDRFDIKHKGLPDIGKNLESCESLIAAAESTGSNLGGYRAAADDCESR